MTLATKLSQIMGEVGGLKKDGRNESQKYNFVTADAVMTALRDRFAAHGIAFFTSMTDVWQETIEKTKTYDGKTTIQVYTHTRARFEFTFIDGEDGTTFTNVWFGESDDYGDKGVNKCATAAVKYFLLKMFLIHTDDQPDADADNDAQRQSRHGNQQKRNNPPKRGENGHSSNERAYMCNAIETVEKDGRKLLELRDGKGTALARLISRAPLQDFIDADVYSALGDMGRHTLNAPINVVLDGDKFVRVEKA